MDNGYNEMIIDSKVDRCKRVGIGYRYQPSVIIHAMTVRYLY